MANATPGQQDASFLPPLRIFLQCFIVVLSLSLAAKERSPKFWLRSTLVFATYRKFDLFFHALYAFDRDNIKYEIGSQILCHTIHPVKICHPRKTGLAAGLFGGVDWADVTKLVDDLCAHKKSGFLRSYLA